MRKAPDRTALAAYHQELADLFGQRRCACGAPATVVVMGFTPPRDLFEAAALTERQVHEKNLCMQCAGMVEKTA